MERPDITGMRTTGITFQREQSRILLSGEKGRAMTFRFAKEVDCTLILRFIRGLADYEKMSDQVVATEEFLREWIFVKKKAEVDAKA